MPRNDCDTTYDYEYHSDDPYVYPGTKVLVNNFNVRSQRELIQIERSISSVMEAKIRLSPLQGSYDLDHLCLFHKTLFSEIYPWAGKIREKGFLSKGKTLFCASELIVSYSTQIFYQLKKEEYLKGLRRDEFISRVAYYMAELNAIHPFREGNGRTQRAFISQLSNDAGWNLSLELIPKNDLVQAHIQAMVDTTFLRQLLTKTVNKKTRKSPSRTT